MSQSNKTNSVCLIDQDAFIALNKESEILDKYGNSWSILVANCGGPGKYPMHLFKRSFDQEAFFIIHDGECMRIWDDQKKELDGVGCGEFIK